MKSYAMALALTVGFAANVMGQASNDTVDAHVGVAKAAAKEEHTALFGLCAAPEPRPTTPPAAVQPAGTPNRSQWHAEPVKVFDNLYFVGMTEYSSWAVNTSDGIIIIDA